MGKIKAGEDRVKRIEDFKRRAEALGGHSTNIEPSEDLPTDLEEAFWDAVLGYEEAPWTTYFSVLESAGTSLPAADALNDQELTAKLWELIQKLALLQVFLEDTDHLSDRELYTRLCSDVLREDTKELPIVSNCAHHIQMLSGGSVEDNVLYLKYYADELYREDWKNSFPDDPLPPHEDPPWNRDRFLPKPDYASRSDEKPN